MDNKELLQKVVHGLINENDTEAAEAFKAYVTNKTRGLLEADTLKKKAKKVEDDKKPDEDQEIAAKEVVDKCNADD